MSEIVFERLHAESEAELNALRDAFIAGKSIANVERVRIMINRTKKLCMYVDHVWYYKQEDDEDEECSV